MYKISKVFGYARASADSQILDRQIKTLVARGVALDDIFIEKSGTKANRPAFDTLMAALSESDMVIVESLGQLGYSSKDLLATLECFESKYIELIALKENISLFTPTGKMMLTALSALVQFERDIVVQRTQEGLKSARARGRKGGRPKTDIKEVQRALTMYDAQLHSAKEIAETVGISVKTLYNAINERKQAASDI